MEIRTNESELLLCKNHYYTKRVWHAFGVNISISFSFFSILDFSWNDRHIPVAKFRDRSAWKMSLDLKNKSFNVTQRRCSATNNTYSRFGTLLKFPKRLRKGEMTSGYRIRLLTICVVCGEFAPYKRYRTHSQIGWLGRRHTPNGLTRLILFAFFVYPMFTYVRCKSLLEWDCWSPAA